MAESPLALILVGKAEGNWFVCLEGQGTSSAPSSAELEFDSKDANKLRDAAQQSPAAAVWESGGSVPLVAEIVTDDKFAMLSSDPTPLTLVGSGLGARVKTQGSSLVFTRPDSEPRRVAGEDMGVPDFSDLQALATAADRPISSAERLLAISADGAPYWVLPGGAERWLRERRQGQERERKRREMAARKRAADEDAAQQQQLHDDGDHFINPYTFVPLVGDVPQTTPNGHDSLLDQNGVSRLSGWFDAVFTMVSPLVLAADQGHIDGEKLNYPGSSVRGMLRSVHEVVAHGCISMIDPDYVPVHREAMKPLATTARLAVVRDVGDSGRPTEVVCTAEPEWIPIDCFQVPNLHSGSRVVVEGGSPVRVLGRLQRRDGVTVRPATTDDTDVWVAHLSDAGARVRAKTYFVAVGKLTGNDGDVKAIEKDSWSRFQQASRNTNDARELRRDTEDTPDTSGHTPGLTGEWPKRLVSFRGRTMGYRRAADGWLSVGDTIWWVPGTNGQPATLKLATIWRNQGSGPLRMRLPDTTLLPCTDPGDLCPTCSVFGFASQTSNRDKADQRAYASHIRVEHAVSTEPVRTEMVELPPLGEPQPSAGGFYLLNDPDRLRAERKGHKTHWGSTLDADPKTKALRQIAGRKFYWHGQDDDPNGRHRNRQRATEGVRVAGAEMIRKVHVAPTDTRLRCRISFDNLTRDQLRLLLLAVDPTPLFQQKVLPDTTHTYGTHLGGAKPLGYGTATVSIEGLVVQTAGSRYGREDAPDLTLDQARDPSGLTQLESWRGLESVMRIGRVPADRLWYPTLGNFNYRKSEAQRREFDKSFAFFARYTGDRNPMRTLPLATDSNQYVSGKDGDAS